MCLWGQRGERHDLSCVGVVMRSTSWWLVVSDGNGLEYVWSAHDANGCFAEFSQSRTKTECVQWVYQQLYPLPSRRRQPTRTLLPGPVNEESPSQAHQPSQLEPRKRPQPALSHRVLVPNPITRHTRMRVSLQTPAIRGSSPRSEGQVPDQRPSPVGTEPNHAGRPVETPAPGGLSKWPRYGFVVSRCG